MINDIRPQKSLLRAQAIEWRKALPRAEKQKKDFKIQNKVLNLWKFREVTTLLVYCAKPIEVETKILIRRAWDLNKIVAAPRCVPGTQNMEFFIIKSFDDLVCGSFGVMEPDPEKCEKLRDFTSSVCVIPALLYDKDGYRLGYGKGYYDRFLSGYSGACVGICYSDCITENLPHGKYDRRVNIIVTEKDNYFCKS